MSFFQNMLIQIRIFVSDPNLNGGGTVAEPIPYNVKTIAV